MSKVTLLNDNAELLQLSIGGTGCPAVGEFLGSINGRSAFGQAVALLQPGIGGPTVAAFAQLSGEFIDAVKTLC